MTEREQVREKPYQRGTLTLAVGATLGGMLLALGVLREPQCVHQYPFMCEIPALARGVLHGFKPGLAVMLALLLRLLWLRRHECPSILDLWHDLPIRYLAGLIAALLVLMVADNCLGLLT